MSHPGSLLKSRGLRASRRRGQNFLTQPGSAKAIAQSAGIGPDDVILEIGAGLGALTLALAPLAGRVMALEVDRGLFAALEEILAEAGVLNVELRLTDALELDWPALAEQAGGRVVVVGNLPYAISSPLIFEMIKARGYWKSATLMVQREVAQRLATGPGSKDYGRLSVMVQTFCSVRPGLILGPDQFFPRPQVESRVVHLKPRDEPLAAMAEGAGDAWFAAVVKAGFSQRRKTLLNSLSGSLNIDRQRVEAGLADAGIDPRRRAETLSSREFDLVARALAG